MPENVYRLRRLLEPTVGTLEGNLLKCIPSPHDPRDYEYAKLMPMQGDVAGPAEIIDYRPNLPPVFDQGKRGSCVACAAAWTPRAYQEMSQGDYPKGGLSAAFLYAKCKELDGIPEQEGTYLRAAQKVLQKYGICPEGELPYGTLLALPKPKVPEIPDSCLESAKRYRIKSYARLCAPGDRNRGKLLYNIRRALKKEGPFVMALLVCSNFKPDADGILPLPRGFIRGGHAVAIVGNLPKMQCLILRNTWGTGWGKDGYAYLPYEWLTAAYDGGWYVFEAWTSVDMVMPQPAKRIEITPGKDYMLVDEQAVTLDQPALITGNNRLMLPVRAMAGNMGYQVEWDGTKAMLTKPN